MGCTAVLTAAGSGSRLGRPVPKALVPLAGTALVVHAARALAAAGVVDRIVVTAPAGHVDDVAALFPGGSVGPASDGARPVPVVVVAGGTTRQASVAAALATLPLPDGPAVVIVHDAARALAPPALVRRVVDAVLAGAPAVVPGLAVTDTVKQVAATPDGGWLVIGTPERSALRAVQTPQGFDHRLLVRAHAAAADRRDDEARAVSDDAGLVELLGEPVRLVAGEERALKITTAADLMTAERWLSRS
ncbi:2-C-methyl-D-erythritol 4-phosphate cytidylyltransferase [Georgenia sunbinii]|uniref:2-C-methyl-D-erythritol 4-phosphate cytidylyltransferase n=1 Tax=Georgenia sunbinii TaxID=3117728 RepID=UPI002F265FC3